MTDTPRVILSMKWGNRYSADYVNVLYGAVTRYLAEPFRFVCLTDDATGLRPGIEAHPIPDIGLEAPHFARGAWPKLAVFERDLYGLAGRALFIDLDMVLCGDLAPFFDVPGPVVAIDYAAWKTPGAKPRVNTAIFAFTLGSMGHVVDRIRAERDHVVATISNEQDFLGDTVRDAAFWPSEWIVSFKTHLRRPLGADLFGPPDPPPPAARIVAFHGIPRPIDLIRGKPYFWDRFPHMGHGKVPWMVDYWHSNGGGPV